MSDSSEDLPPRFTMQLSSQPVSGDWRRTTIALQHWAFGSMVFDNKRQVFFVIAIAEKLYNDWKLGSCLLRVSPPLIRLLNLHHLPVLVYDIITHHNNAHSRSVINVVACELKGHWNSIKATVASCDFNSVVFRSVRIDELIVGLGLGSVANLFIWQVLTFFSVHLITVSTSVLPCMSVWGYIYIEELVFWSSSIVLSDRWWTNYYCFFIHVRKLMDCPPMCPPNAAEVWSCRRPKFTVKATNLWSWKRFLVNKRLFN